MRRHLRIRTCLLAGAAAITLASCSGSDATNTRSPDAATQAPSASGSPSTSESPSGPATPSENGTKKPYAQKIVDDVMGHDIEFTGVVRGFSLKKFASVTEDGGEFVLVQVKATAGKKYSVGFYGGWKLTSPDGTPHSPATSIAEPDMKTAGYEPFKDLPRGQSGTGWVAFQVNSISPSYTLVYTRPAAKVIGSDTTIPEKVWEFPLS
ncbi:MAG: hypothetical protein ACRCYU_13615 [Nocardioides sp.]